MVVVLHALVRFVNKLRLRRIVENININLNLQIGEPICFVCTSVVSAIWFHMSVVNIKLIVLCFYAPKVYIYIYTAGGLSSITHCTRQRNALLKQRSMRHDAATEWRQLLERQPT